MPINHYAELTQDRRILNWIIEQFNRPGMGTSETGEELGLIIAGGVVDGAIYESPREALIAAISKR